MAFLQLFLLFSIACSVYGGVFSPTVNSPSQQLINGWSSRNVNSPKSKQSKQSPIPNPVPVPAPGSPLLVPNPGLVLPGQTQNDAITPAPSSASGSSSNTSANTTGQQIIQMDTIEDLYYGLLWMHPDRIDDALAHFLQKFPNAKLPTQNTNTSSNNMIVADSQKDWAEEVLSRPDVQQAIAVLVSQGRGDVGVFKDDAGNCYITDRDTQVTYYQFQC